LTDRRIRDESTNKVRGLQPWPLASTWMGGRRLIILKTRVEGGAGETDPASSTDIGQSAPRHNRRRVA